MGIVDQGFVPAPADRVYARLAAVEGYGAWWPGARTAGGDGTVELRLSRLAASSVTVEAERPDVGLVLRLRGGDAAGTLEWYLQPFKEGTIVNAIFDADPGGRARPRVVRRVREELRRGLVALRGLEARS